MTAPIDADTAHADKPEVIILYRPVGRKELDLIREAGFRAFPPRLSWQPIFYPVLTEAYAVQIARDWNTKDAASGYVGYVTRFRVQADFLQPYPVQEVGSRAHQEYWIPAEDLPQFNAALVGPIEIVAEFHSVEEKKRMSMTYTDQLPATATGRKRWSRDDCQFLENAGLLKSIYELIDGEIIIKMGQHRRRARVLAMLIKFLNEVYGAERVQSQATMEVRGDDRVLNRPEPDAAVLREDIDYTPFGTDVLLAVEVSDTTQADDYGAKVGLYARAGVGEYWVLDLTRRVLVAFRLAQNDEWQARQEFADGAQIAPLSAPDNFVAVSDLLPPLHEQA